MLVGNRPRFGKKKLVRKSLVGHRNYSEWNYRQETKLANLNRQDYTLNVDGEDLESFPLA